MQDMIEQPSYHQIVQFDRGRFMMLEVFALSLGREILGLQKGEEGAVEHEPLLGRRH